MMEKLIKKLQAVDTVKSRKWDTVLAIHKVFDKVTIKEKEWADSFKNKNPDLYPLDLSNIKIWSTYDIKCIKLDFYIKEGELMCDAVIYDGDLYDGHMKGERFRAKLCIPINFISEIENEINREFDIYLDEEYEEYLEEQKKVWKELKEKELLK